MARSAVTVTNTDRNGDAAITYTDLSVGATGSAGYYVTFDRDEMLIEVKNTGSATGTFDILAGDDEYVNHGVGALNVTVGGNVTKAIIIEGSRFMQDSQQVYFDSGITGTVAVIDPTGM